MPHYEEQRRECDEGSLGVVGPSPKGSFGYFRYIILILTIILIQLLPANGRINTAGWELTLPCRLGGVPHHSTLIIRRGVETHIAR